MKKRKAFTEIDGNCLSILPQVDTDPKELGGRGFARGPKTPRASNLSDEVIENNTQYGGGKKRFQEDREEKAEKSWAPRAGELPSRSRSFHLENNEVKGNTKVNIITNIEPRNQKRKPFQRDYFQSIPRSGDVDARESEQRTSRRTLNTTIGSSCSIECEPFSQRSSIDERELTVSRPFRIRTAEEHKPDASSTFLSQVAYVGKSSRKSLCIGSRKIEEQHTDCPMQVWSVEGNSSSPLHFKIDGKIYLHPQLPSGWEIVVSESQKRPFYVHPDFGSTWHCPIILPKKAVKNNLGDVDNAWGEQIISVGHPASKKNHTSVVTRVPISKKPLDKSVSRFMSMSELVTRYNCEKRYQDGLPVDGLRRQTASGGCNMSPTTDVEDSLSDMESSSAEIFCFPSLATPTTPTGSRSTDIASKSVEGAREYMDSIRELRLDRYANVETSEAQVQQQNQEVQNASTLEMKYSEISAKEGDIPNPTEMTLASSSRLQRDKNDINSSPRFHDSPQPRIGDDSKARGHPNNEAVKNNPKTAKDFNECKKSDRYSEKKCISDPSVVCGRECLSVGVITNDNPRSTQRPVFPCTNTADTYLLQETRGCIFRQASVVATPYFNSSTLSKNWTASTESSSMSESSARIHGDYSSDRKSANLGTPDTTSSAVTPSYNSDMESNFASRSSVEQKRKVYEKLRQASTSEESHSSAYFEGLQTESGEEVWGIWTPPSRIRVENETPNSHAVDFGSTTERKDPVCWLHLLRKAELGVTMHRNERNLVHSFVTTPASASDESGKIGDKQVESDFSLGSPEKGTIPCTKMASSNEQESPLTHNLCFDVDFSGSQVSMEEQPISRLATPASAANDGAEKAITLDRSGDRTTTGGLGLVAAKSPCLETDFFSSNSDSADEGTISPNISSHCDQFSAGVNMSNSETHLREAWVHTSYDSIRQESSSAIQSKTNTATRKAVGRSMPHRWEVWNHPLCSLQRLDDLNK